MTAAIFRAGAILKIDAQDSREVIAATRQGVAVAAVDELVKSGRASIAEIDRLVLPRKTLSHRRKSGALTPEQSDRLLRFARAIAGAEETFGSPEKAAMWLRRPTAALGDQSPISLLDTGEGCREVERLLGRIDHGLAA